MSRDAEGPSVLLNRSAFSAIKRSNVRGFTLGLSRFSSAPAAPLACASRSSDNPVLLISSLNFRRRITGMNPFSDIYDPSLRRRAPMAARKLGGDRNWISAGKYTSRSTRSSFAYGTFLFFCKSHRGGNCVCSPGGGAYNVFVIIIPIAEREREVTLILARMFRNRRRK